MPATEMMASLPSIPENSYKAYWLTLYSDLSYFYFRFNPGAPVLVVFLGISAYYLLLDLNSYNINIIIPKWYFLLFSALT